jgi:hypothetical protein
VCDEVYEHQVFPGHKHISLRSLPGMAERTVSTTAATAAATYAAATDADVASSGPAAPAVSPPLPLLCRHCCSSSCCRCCCCCCARWDATTWRELTHRWLSLCFASSQPTWTFFSCQWRLHSNMLAKPYQMTTQCISRLDSPSQQWQTCHLTPLSPCPCPAGDGRIRLHKLLTNVPH